MNASHREHGLDSVGVAPADRSPLTALEVCRPFDLSVAWLQHICRQSKRNLLVHKAIRMGDNLRWGG